MKKIVKVEMRDRGEWVELSDGSWDGKELNGLAGVPPELGDEIEELLTAGEECGDFTDETGDRYRWEVVD